MNSRQGAKGRETEDRSEETEEGRGRGKEHWKDGELRRSRPCVSCLLSPIFWLLSRHDAGFLAEEHPASAAADLHRAHKRLRRGPRLVGNAEVGQDNAAFRVLVGAFCPADNEPINLAVLERSVQELDSSGSHGSDFLGFPAPCKPCGGRRGTVPFSLGENRDSPRCELCRRRIRKSPQARRVPVRERFRNLLAENEIGPRTRERRLAGRCRSIAMPIPRAAFRQHRTRSFPRSASEPAAQTSEVAETSEVC